MRHFRATWWPVLVASLFLGCAGTAVDQVRLRVGNMLYPRFHDVATVRVGETFQVGDTEYSAKIVKFIPDFVFDDRSRKIVSRSDEPLNPAVLVEVYKDGVKVEESWAFPVDVPHFSREATLTFQVEDWVWKPGRGPRQGVAPDSAGPVPADSLMPVDSPMPADSTGR